MLRTRTPHLLPFASHRSLSGENSGWTFLLQDRSVGLELLSRLGKAKLLVEYQLKDLNPKGFNAKEKRRVIVQG